MRGRRVRGTVPEPRAGLATAAVPQVAQVRRVAVGTRAAEMAVGTAMGAATVVRVLPATVPAALAAGTATVLAVATAVTVAAAVAAPAAAEPAVLAVPALAILVLAAPGTAVPARVLAPVVEATPVGPATAVRQPVTVARAPAPVLPVMEAPVAESSLKEIAPRMRVSHPPRTPRPTGFYLEAF